MVEEKHLFCGCEGDKTCTGNDSPSKVVRACCQLSHVCVTSVTATRRVSARIFTPFYYLYSLWFCQSS